MTNAVKLLTESVIQESPRISKSNFDIYVKAIFAMQKNILPTIMEDDNLSLDDKIKLVKIYYEVCIGSFHDAFYHNAKWESKEKDQENKYNFLKIFISKYGSLFDESVECFNYIRWMYACLSLNYNVEDFHANMRILMKQLEEISIQKNASTKEFLNIWTRFDEVYDFFEYEMINPKLISKYILPHIKDYLSFSESLLENKNFSKEEWYSSVVGSLKNYSKRYGSGFLTLFKEYEAKYYNCIGVDYKVTKKQ